MFTIGTFQAVRGQTAAAVSILGRTTAIELGMLRVGSTEHPLRNTDFVAAIQLLTKYDCLFRGVGELKNYQHTLHTDSSIKPVTEKHRRLPFHQI